MDDMRTKEAGARGIYLIGRMKSVKREFSAFKLVLGSPLSSSRTIRFNAVVAAGLECVCDPAVVSVSLIAKASRRCLVHVRLA